jgi:superfamily II DNA helicase RecQ
MKVQWVFCSGTHPPHLHEIFCKKAALEINANIIRMSTDRPELCHHVLMVNSARSHIPVWESLKHLVFHLKTGSLQTDERIVIFFQDETEADNFAAQMGCSKYHSKLPSQGKSKGYYFDLWAAGEQVVMAASTTFQQGVDYPWVAFIIYYRSAYGLIDFDQGAGHGGRRGRFSYAIVLRDEGDHSTCEWSRMGMVKDTHCELAFLQLTIDSKSCKHYLISRTMDGEELARTCKTVAGSNHCGICDPNSTMAKLFRQVLNIPLPSATLFTPPITSAQIENDSDEEYGSMEFTAEMAQVMDDAIVPRISEVNTL